MRGLYDILQCDVDSVQRWMFEMRFSWWLWLGCCRLCLFTCPGCWPAALPLWD